MLPDNRNWRTIVLNLSAIWRLLNCVKSFGVFSFYSFAIIVIITVLLFKEMRSYAISSVKQAFFCTDVLRFSKDKRYTFIIMVTYNAQLKVFPYFIKANFYITAILNKRCVHHFVICSSCLKHMKKNQFNLLSFKYYLENK